jgi:hypothetical protein
VPSPSMPGSDDAPVIAEELTQRARLWFPDVDPVQLARAVEQAFALKSYDDHGLTAFAIVVSMLKVGIPVEDVVQVVALTKLNLMSQHVSDGGQHPDDITE